MLQNHISSKQDSEIKEYTLCLGNILKIFTMSNMQQTKLKESIKFFSFDFNPIGTNDVLDIHKHLMKRT